MRDAFKYSVFLLSINMVVKVTWVLGIEVFMQRQLGLNDYGIYYSLLNMSFLFAFLLDFGIARYNSTITARDGLMAEAQFGGIMRLKFFLSFVYLIATALISWSLGYTGQQLFYLLLLAVIQIFASYILFFRSTFSGLKSFRTEGWISIADKLLMVIACSTLLFSTWRSLLSLPVYLAIQFFAVLLVFLVAWNQISSLHKKSYDAIINVNFKHIASIGLPFTLLMALETVNDKIGIVVLERIIENGAVEAGYYAYGLRLLDAYKMFAALVGVVLMPYFADHIKSSETTRGYIRLGLTILVFPTFSVISLFWFYQQEAIEMLYRGQSGYTKTLVLINLVSTIPYSLIYVFQPLSTAHLQIKKLNFIWALALVLNVTLIAFTLSETKAVGVSIAFLSSASFAAVALFVTSPIRFSLRQIMAYLFKFLLYACIEFLIIYQLKSSVGFFLICIILIPYNLFAITMLRFFSIKDLRQLLHKKLS